MNITNITSISDLLIFANKATYGFFGLGIMFLLFTILYLELVKKFNMQVSIFFSLVLLMPVFTILTILGFFDSNAIIVYMLLMGLAGLYAYIKKDEVYY